MCGIAGFYHAPVSQQQVDSLFGLLKHRGPDDRNFYRHKNTGLIHTRLSILELSNLGAQPYRFENLVLVLNGEIYNYREIREELKKKGYFFQSNSDTEVVIKAFHCWKEACVQRFIGMFAFALFDESTDELFLFRDRLGVKPLYYSIKNESLFFGSELKTLAAFNIDKEVDLDAVFYYFRFGFIPHSLSIFKQVSKLEAGHYLKITSGGISKSRYWQYPSEPDLLKSEETWLDEIEEMMTSAFNYRMVSDVPVGVFLSGGIDSSLLTAILSKKVNNLRSFTIGFEEDEFDESSYAVKVAQHLGTQNTQQKLTLNHVKDLLQDFYAIYDEPFADTSGLPVACLTQLAKNNGVKVVLSADGGDELFGGYTHYQQAFKLQRLFFTMPSVMRQTLAKGSRTLIPQKLRSKIISGNIEHRLHAMEELLKSSDTNYFFEAFLANQAADEINHLIPGIGRKKLSGPSLGNNPWQDMMLWDLNYYLPDNLLVKVDRATMFYGIECREPFLDHRLVELSMRIPVGLKVKNGKGKYLLRKLLSRYVPEKYFERKKQGFSIPLFAWFSQELDVLFKEYFCSEKVSEIPFLNYGALSAEYAKYDYYKRRGKAFNIEKMWRILSFMLWWEKYAK